MEIHKIGDKIIALNSTTKRNTQPRTVGKIYVVKNIHTCPHCDCQYVNFGYTTKILQKQCNGCDGSFLSGFLKWTPSKFYININDIKKTLEKALEDEDYQLAIILRDIDKPKHKV